jgi:AcrR family transcriptional regulator
MSTTGDTAVRIDGRRARGDSTRRAILRRAMQIASVEGLDRLSLAGLAADLEMSKSGLFAHFGSKEELQLSTLRAARRVFSDLAVEPAQALPEGIERLRALTGSWLVYIDADAFEGGCVFMQAAAEFDARPGPVRDLVAESMARWMALLTEQARAAIARGELIADTDPEQLAWELHAFGLALNWDRQLNASPAAPGRARAAMTARLHAAATAEGRRRLGTSSG